MITRYGADDFSVLIISGLIFIAGGIITHVVWLAGAFYAAAALFISFAFWFFRDPERVAPDDALRDNALVVAPADGKVVQITRVDETRLVGADAIQISIFLSPLDVHVNRIPISGEVVFSDYRPGKFHMAFHHKASEKNEQTIIGVSTANGPVVFKQITGFLARRIVCKLQPQASVRVGERFGMMKFGSRMDVIMPNSSEVYVKIGDRVVGGQSIVGRIAEPSQ